MHTISTQQHKLFWLFAAGALLCLLAAMQLKFPVIAILPFVGVFACYAVINVSYLYYVLIVALPISINLLEVDSISLDFPDEPIMLILTALFPFLFLQFKNLGINNKIINHPVVTVLIIWLGWIAVTIFTSTFPILSIKHFLSKIWYLVPFVGMTIYIILDNVKSLKKIFLLYMEPLVVLVLIVTYRHSKLNFAFELVTVAGKPFFYNHVVYGSIVSLFLPLCVGVLWMTKRFTWQWFAMLFACIVFFTGLYFSYSRGAWAAVIFAIGIFVAIKLRIVHYCFMLFFIAITAAAIFMQSDNKYLEFAPKLESGIMHENLVDHLIATLKGKDVSSNERFYRWVAGARMSAQKPVFGYGPNTFYENYKPYTINAFRTYVSRNNERSTMHNYFLFVLVEQGYVGLFLYALCIFLIFYNGQQLYHRLQDKMLKKIVITILCMLGAFFINNCLSELIENDKLGGCFLIGIGILVALDIKQKMLKENNKDLIW